MVMVPTVEDAVNWVLAAPNEPLGFTCLVPSERNRPQLPPASGADAISPPLKP